MSEPQPEKILTLPAVQREIERLSKIRQEAWSLGGVDTSRLSRMLYDLFADKRLVISRRHRGTNPLDIVSTLIPSQPYDYRKARAR